MIAQDAAEKLTLSSVLFIPAACPPHKQHVRQAAAVHRLKMIEMAVAGNPQFAVSDIEIRRSGLSFTMDTIAELNATYRDADLFLIIGSDTLMELHTWHRIEELLEMCNVATILRPGIDSIDTICSGLPLPERYRTQLLEHVMDGVRIDISSTEIRRRIAAGESIRYLVHPAVEAYIIENDLYQE